MIWLELYRMNPKTYIVDFVPVVTKETSPPSVLDKTKYFIINFLKFFVLPVFATWVFISWFNYSHTHFLYKIGKELNALEVHYADSELVKSYRHFGSYYNDSWDCSYAVAEWRRSKLSKEELTNQYKDVLIKSGLQVMLSFLDESSGLDLAHPADAWHTRASREVLSDDEYVNYLIYVFSKQNPTLTDFRCFENVEIDEEVIDLM